MEQDPPAATPPPPPSPPLPQQQSLSVAELSSVPDPRQFYQTYVAPRRPVVFRHQAAAILLENANITIDLTVETLLQMATTKSSTSSAGSADTNFVQVNVAAPRVSAADHTRGGSVVDNNRISFSPHDGSRVISMDLKTLCSNLLSSSPEIKDDNNTGAADESGSPEKSCDHSYYYMTTQTLPVDDEGRPAVCSWLPQILIDRQIVPLRPKILGHLIPMSSAGLWLGRTPNHHDHHDATTNNVQ
jgi:hypothetical protein